jgi:hypothetical protein
MDEIAELERRITAALERIGDGMERRLRAPAGAAAVTLAEIDRLREELDEERMANAQLSERLRVQRERSERAAGVLRAEVDRLTRQVDEQALAMQRMVTSTIQMREEMRRLREDVQAGGAVNPALIDKALVTELEAYRATRGAESAELAGIIAALTPIVEAEEAKLHA